MSKSSSDASGGLTSSAGLTTYYDSEEQYIALDPKTIILFCVLVSLFFILLNVAL